MSKLYELAENYRNLLELADNEGIPFDVIKEGIHIDGASLKQTESIRIR